MYQESGASIDDADGLVDYARSIQGVEVGVLLEERNGALKGSLRAKILNLGWIKLLKHLAEAVMLVLQV